MSKNLTAMQAMEAAKLRESYNNEAELSEARRVLQATNELDPASARVVAAAVRVATIKELGEEAGLDDDTIGGIVGEETDPSDLGMEPGDEPDNMVEQYEEEGTLPIPGEETDEMGLEDAPEGDLSDDGGLVDVHFQAPKSELPDIEELLAEILGEAGAAQEEDFTAPDAGAEGLDNFGDEEEEPLMGESDDLAGDDLADRAGDDAAFGEDITSGEDLGDTEDEDAGFERPTTMASSRGTDMQNNNAERRELRAAMREAANRVANTEPKDIGLGRDTTDGTYGGERAESIQHAEKAQYKGEAKTPSKTMSNSEGNSLKGDNPSFNKRKIPTKNPDNLQFGSEYETLTFENESNELDYKVDFGKLDIPSKGEADRTPGFEVPTQNAEYTTNRDTNTGGNTVTAGAEEEGTDFEDHMFRTLMAAGIPEAKLAQISFEEGKRAYDQLMAQRAAGQKSDWFKSNVEGKDEDLEEVGGKKADKLDITVDAKTASVEAIRKEYANALEHEIKRVKAAYSVNSQLFAHGLIRPEEIDAHVELWLNDSNMSVKAMYVTGQMMLRTAGNLQKQVAASAGDQMVRTSSRGISAVPAVVNAPQYSSVESNDLSGLFSIGNLPRQAFNKFREYDELQRAYGSYAREFNPLID
ncbi:MAG: hypothetical protein ACAH95_13930 [Fimbriimonas sp.]